MKKVLVITYYWPPSGGAGVQRWLKFVKYLRNYGWEPIIYTPENPEIPAIDKSLEKDIPEGITVLKTKVWEPYSAYKRFVGRKKEDSIKAGFLSEKKNPSLTEKISVWIRGNYFIPDARKFWIRPSIKYLLNYLNDNPVDAMVSTGPPHSMHMIALGIKQNLNIPWLADFRDPWTNIDFYDKLMLSARADRKHRRMELKVIKNADNLVTVNWNMAKEFRELGAKNVEVVTNGFDPDDFKDIKSQPSEKFEIFHIGSMNKDRNPKVFWKALRELVNEYDSFSNHLKITFIGQTDYSVFEEIEKNSLNSYVNNILYKPHDELMTETAKASILFLPLNNTTNANGITPGKLFEYLALNRPIFCIGPEDGDSAKIIHECNAGVVINFDEKDKIKIAIQKFYTDFIDGKLDEAITDSNRLNYTRKKLTYEIATLLETISDKK
ncbi:MAG: glycosyltransferase family 4 protein [Bacteroidales bacterium]|nr:glycosyltransferase family 4 protein [Bacteroidales bacterium]